MIRFIILSLLISCQFRDIIVGDIVPFKIVSKDISSEDISLSDGLELISSYEDSGKHYIKILVKKPDKQFINIRSKKVEINVKPILPKEDYKAREHTMKIIYPNITKSDNIIFYFVILLSILLILFLAWKDNKFKYEYYKDIKQYTERSLTKKELYEITSILRDYLNERLSIPKGVSLDVIIRQLRARDMSTEIIEEVFSEISYLKYSGTYGEISGTAEKILDFMKKTDKKLNIGK